MSLSKLRRELEGQIIEENNNKAISMTAFDNRIKAIKSTMRKLRDLELQAARASRFNVQSAIGH